MKTRMLGNNHLSVSTIGLGCWGMSHAYGPADETESIATLNRCLDLGINFLDTADVYGQGHNEQLIARVLKKRRHEAVVATKFGFVGDEHGQVGVCGRPEYVQQACEQSLKRLCIDEIDLYYFHRLDPHVPIEETVGAMARLINQGKVRYIGLSEVSAQTLEKAASIHPVTALQSEYSLWHRDVENRILPACKRLNISLVPFCPLGRGFLTGTLHCPDDLDKEDYRSSIPRFEAEAMAKNQLMVNQLKQLSEKSSATPSQLALAWLLDRDPSIVPIPGMKKRIYIEENMASAKIRLSDEILKGLNALGRDVCGRRHNEYNLHFVEE